MMQSLRKFEANEQLQAALALVFVFPFFIWLVFKVRDVFATTGDINSFLFQYFLFIVLFGSGNISLVMQLLKMNRWIWAPNLLPIFYALFLFGLMLIGVVETRFFHLVMSSLLALTSVYGLIKHWKDGRKINVPQGDQH